MISVIIPTWEPDEYFYDLLESLKLQTLDHNLYEVLIVFNNTSLEKVNVFSEYIIKNLSNTKIFNLKESGVSFARNFGMKNSLGQYFCFLDDDDVISSNFLENLYFLRSENTIVVSNVLAFTEIDKPMKDYLTLEKKISSSNLLHCRSVFSTVWAKLIPRILINDLKFNETLKNGEDALFMYSISLNVRKILSTDLDTVYFRRLRAGSASRKKRNILDMAYNSFKQAVLYTKFYFSSPLNYSILFLMNRYMAICKKFLIDFGVWK